MTAAQEAAFLAGQALAQAEAAEEKTADARRKNARTSAVTKLKAMGLTQEQADEIVR